MDRANRLDVDTDAIAGNVERLRRLVAPAALCAVVKGDGYGHGAISVAGAAIDGGADALGVATVGEAATLRSGGHTVPILVLSEPHPSAWATVAELDLEVMVHTEAGVGAASALSAQRPRRVHLKIDTGMHRVGVQPEEVAEFAGRIVEDRALELVGVCSHFARADSDPASVARQAQLFDRVAAGLGPFSRDGRRRHLANSAAALRYPDVRHEMVRTGIALYGLDPGGMADRIAELGLRPALALRTEVTAVRRVRAGESVSYGDHRVEADTMVATLPLGYADGIPRRAGQGVVDVLVGARRWTTVGVVTMDQMMVRPRDPVAEPPNVGDEVVLIGRQGDERITVGDWASALGTIDYEVTTALRRRLST